MSDGIRWLKVGEAADRARCGPKTIYRAVRSGQLRSTRVGGRRELRFLPSWIDCWLLGEETEELRSHLGDHRQVGGPLVREDGTSEGCRLGVNVGSPSASDTQFHHAWMRRGRQGEPLARIVHVHQLEESWHMPANASYGRRDRSGASKRRPAQNVRLSTPRMGEVPTSLALQLLWRGAATASA